MGDAMANRKTNDKCFACDRALGRNPKQADTRDDQIVSVGSDCYSKIETAGEAGYQPPKGGPRLYPGGSVAR